MTDTRYIYIQDLQKCHRKKSFCTPHWIKVRQPFTVFKNVFPETQVQVSAIIHTQKFPGLVNNYRTGKDV